MGKREREAGILAWRGGDVTVSGGDYPISEKGKGGSWGRSQWAPLHLCVRGGPGAPGATLGASGKRS